MHEWQPLPCSSKFEPLEAYKNETCQRSLLGTIAFAFALGFFATTTTKESKADSSRAGTIQSKFGFVERQGLNHPLEE